MVLGNPQASIRLITTTQSSYSPSIFADLLSFHQSRWFLLIVLMPLTAFPTISGHFSELIGSMLVSALVILKRLALQSWNDECFVTVNPI